MAYTDGGEIWYTKTEQDAINWPNEMQVSNGNGDNHNPSVTTLGNIAYLSWAQKTGSTWNIRYRTYNNDSGSWGATETIASFSSTSTPTPQIALSENPVRVMVASNVSGNVKAWLRKNGSWQYAGLNISGDQPSLCSNQPAQPAAFDDIILAYRNNDNIYLRNWTSLSESWSGAKQVSVITMSSLGNQKPSVNYSGGNAMTSWQGFNDEIGTICIYERSWNASTNGFSS